MKQVDALVEHLAKLNGLSVGDPTPFGGGALQARVSFRAEAVAYGYPAVVDEYTDPDNRTAWCTLTVMLPCAVPALTIEHRSALGRPGVPTVGLEQAPFGDALFDQSFLAVVGFSEPYDTVNLVGPDLRDALMRNPVQRMQYSGSTLLVRTFDNTRAVDETTEWLERVAGRILAATPAYTSVLGGPGQPFPQGLYGHDSDEGSRPSGWRAFRAWLSGLGAGRD